MPVPRRAARQGWRSRGCDASGAKDGPEPLQCKDCENWYGAEDDEFGPCMLKNMRGDLRYITQGVFRCDEGRTVLDKEERA